MGMYLIPCQKCNQEFMWYSGYIVQVCNICNGIERSMTVESVKRLVIEEGEHLLVRLPDTYTTDQARMITDSLKKIFDKNKVVVYRGDIQFEVVRGTPFERK